MFQTVQPGQSMQPAEAAEVLGVSVATLARWVRDGRIRALRLPSGRLRYDRAEIERLASEGLGEAS